MGWDRVLCCDTEVTEKRPQSGNTVLGSSPGEDTYVARKLRTRVERRQYQGSIFCRGDCGNEDHKNKEPLLGSTPR